MITAVRRRSDGLLEDLQGISVSGDELVIDVAARIRNAQAAAGGSTEDWQVVRLADEVTIEAGYVVYGTVDEAGVVQSVTYGKAIDIPPEPEPEVTLEELKTRVEELQRLIERME